MDNLVVLSPNNKVLLDNLGVWRRIQIPNEQSIYFIGWGNVNISF
jgi:hypothetical protein